MSTTPLEGPWPDTVPGRVLDALGPAFRDQAGPLLVPLVEALTSQLQVTDDMLAAAQSDPDTGAAGTWSRVFDLDLTPFPRWLGIATGSPVPAGYTPVQAREFVRDRGPWRRGTPGAIRGAARAHLVGTRRVELVERDGSPWRLRVRVYASELAYPGAAAAVAGEVAAHKPVGIVLAVEIAAGATFAHMSAHHGPTFADYATGFSTFADATTHVPEENT